MHDTLIYYFFVHIKRMRGCLMYHRTHGRHIFIDEICVVPNARRNGIAKSMIHFICKGPIELIVRANNLPALSLYSSLRFCSVDRGYYMPNENEIYMKTQSFRKTLALLPINVQHSCEVFKWNDMTKIKRKQVTEMIEKEYNVGHRRAKQILRTHDNDMFYVCVF